MAHNIAQHGLVSRPQVGRDLHLLHGHEGFVVHEGRPGVRRRTQMTVPTSKQIHQLLLLQAAGRRTQQTQRLNG
jgi:hypothetical protein